MTNEELVRAYARATAEFDFDALAKLRHPDWKGIWPQSGEVVPDTEADRRITEAYPGGRPRLVPGQMIGSEDRYIMSPAGIPLRVAGEGENWWGVWNMIYPDGRRWFTIIMLELRDGKVLRETLYWAEPFEAPAWREPLVDRLPESPSTGRPAPA